MNDYISRQTATKTALTFFVEYLGGAFHEDMQAILKKRFEELPSAKVIEKEEILGWLLSCRDRSFEINGWFEADKVIGWLINDFTENLYKGGEQE